MAAAPSSPRRHSDRSLTGFGRSRCSHAWIAAGIVFAVLLLAGRVGAVEVSEGEDKLRTGDYAGVIALAEKALREKDSSEEWPLLQGRALLTVGRYPEARSALTNALTRFSRSVRIHWLAREAFLASGHPDEASDALDQIKDFITGRSPAFRDPPSMVVFARVALSLGADPKVVLERLLDPVRKADPRLTDASLARGELALDKHDFALAAKAFEDGLQHHPDEPDLLYGMARAVGETSRSALAEKLEAALKINPRHIPSLLLVIDHRIDAEDYSGARKGLDEVLAINPWNPEAWAYRAVIEHLRNDTAAERTARESALKFWPDNPRVDHLIGLKLSQKYRFAEGASHQRQALKFDESHLPARAQLASDLLRLGDESEGWRQATAVHEKDGYDVAAFNLVTLHDTMARFTTLTNARFAVRMASNEAGLYGGRVLALLDRAQAKLVAKYGLEPVAPTLVEIFADQKDFGVRTFGMPENPGYLGVCFGRVVTANSPAATRSHPVNWEAVLWHEFTHVITLQMTANKMPRWLSEGISVHEELQENPSWGQHMTPRYRSMILAGELTPVSRLSGAFMAPKTPFHLQFAYFESAMVVDFIVERFGPESIRSILIDLKEGVEINEAIRRHTRAMPELEKEFTAYARDRAQRLGPGLDWEPPGGGGDGSAPSVPKVPTPGELLRGTLGAKLAAAPVDMAPWAKAHPTNYWAIQYRAKEAMTAHKWTEALAELDTLVALSPNQVGGDSPWRSIAKVCRELGNTDREQAAWMRLAALDDEATDAYERLMELGAAAGNGPLVLENARRYLAVNPLVALPYRRLADAGEASGDTAGAIDACRALLQLDPANPPDIHFQLARLLQSDQPAAARRHLLQTLEEAPRHRGALQLLARLGPSPEPAPQKPEPTDSPRP